MGIAISPQGPVALGKTGSTLIPASALPVLAGISNAAGLTASGAVAPNELIPSEPGFDQNARGSGGHPVSTERSRDCSQGATRGRAPSPARPIREGT